MKYFAYGSNMNQDDMAYRCPSATPIGSWTLPNHKLCFRSVADVVPCEDNDVVGALWEIQANDEYSLDRYEGYPTLYDKYWHDDIMYYRMQLISTDDDMFYMPARFYLDTMLEGYDDFDIDRTALLKNIGFPKLAEGIKKYQDGEVDIAEGIEISGVGELLFVRMMMMLRLEVLDD